MVRKNKKIVWIVNQYAVLPDSFGGTRHYDFAKILSNQNLEFFVICSSYSNFERKETQNFGGSLYKIQKIKQNFNFVYIKTPSYKSNGLDRVYNSVIFGKRLNIVAKNIVEPDLIIGSSPQLISTYRAMKLAKKLKVPFIFEVRDIWPQTLIDLGMNKLNPIIIYFKFLEKRLILHSDKIVAIMPLFKNYAKEKFNLSSRKIVWISNGIADEYVNLFKEKKVKKRFIVTYSGTIGKAQNCHDIIDAAYLTKNYSDIIYQFIGEGVEKKLLIKKVKELKIKRVVHFSEPTSKEKIFGVLRESDVFILPLKSLGVFKYGCQPNKMFDYMAMGRPIIFLSDSNNDTISKAHCGIKVKPGSPEKLAKVIIRLYKTPKNKLDKIGKNGHDFVVDHYLISKLATKYLSVISELINK